MSGPAGSARTVEGGQRPARRLWPLWAMIAVFAAPVVATWFYFFFPQYLPETRSNRGEILHPPVYGHHYSHLLHRRKRLPRWLPSAYHRHAHLALANFPLPHKRKEHLLRRL